VRTNWRILVILDLFQVSSWNFLNDGFDGLRAAGKH
jgi:hypothetical protein